MNRTAFPTKQSSPGTQELCFIFNTNGASDPATSSFDGAKSFVASVKHTSTGKYTVTLADAQTKVLWAEAELDDTVDDGAYATLGGISNEGTATPTTLVINTRAGSTTTKTDYSARKVMLRLCLKNTTVSG